MGRANRLRAMTGLQEVAVFDADGFTRLGCIWISLRNQIQVLCKHHIGQHGEGRLLQLLLPAAVRAGQRRRSTRYSLCSRGRQHEGRG